MPLPGFPRDGTCVDCFGVFSQNSPNQKRCDDCQAIRNRKLSREWEAKKREKERAPQLARLRRELSEKEDMDTRKVANILSKYGDYEIHPINEDQWAFGCQLGYRDIQDMLEKSLLPEGIRLFWLFDQKMYHVVGDQLPERLWDIPLEDVDFPSQRLELVDDD